MGLLAGSLFDLRRGERGVAFLMGANYFLLLLFYYLLKPARDALFLVDQSPDRLPFVYILTALVAAPVTAAYARAGMRHRLDRLILRTTAFLVLNLVLLYLLLPAGSPWLFYVFYAWVGVAGGLTTSQFWLQANGLFDASQAKRIFPLLGVGGIAGAFCGGEITGFLVGRAGLQTTDLLLVSAGVLAAATGLGLAAWRTATAPPEAAGDRGREETRSAGDLWGILQSVLRSRHLSLTVGIISLAVLTASFVDFQFKTVSWESYPDGADLTGFLGRFYGRMSLLSLLFQLLVAPRLIRGLGVGNTVLVLPAVLLVGAVAMFAAPGLLAARVLRGSDIVLKYSLDKTSRELLFLPIPLALKKRTKVFVDMFIDRWARGLAGAVLLLLTGVLGLGERGVAGVTVLLLAAWIVLAALMRRVYVDSFRQALTRREIDLRDVRVRIEDAGSLGVLVGALAGGNRRELVYALDMLQGVTAPAVGDAVRPLLGHEAAAVRRRALVVLAANAREDDAALVRTLTADPDLGVRVAAVAFLAAHRTDDEQREFVAGLLDGPGAGRNAALAWLGEPDAPPALRELVTREVVVAVRDCPETEGCEGRRVLAGLPWLPASCGPDLWDDLLGDEDPEVVAAGLAGIGRRGDSARVPWLLDQLGHPRRRTGARAALATLATAQPAVIDDLERYLFDSGRPPRQRAEIPRALATVPDQRSVDVLIRRLGTGQPNLRFDVLRGLGKLRAGYPDLVFDREVISHEVCIEAGRYIQLAAVESLLPSGGERQTLLCRAIGETQQLRLESVFRLLGLLYPAKDLLNAYHGVMSGRRVLRANAQEFLDNVLRGNHRQLVLALLDEQPASEAWRETLVGLGAEFTTPIGSASEALAFLGSSCDPWLAACAIFAGGDVQNPSAAPHLIRTGGEMLSPIEKVLLLQHVDIFSEVASGQLAALAAISREVPHLAGDEIYREDDSPDALYLVLEGSVRLSQGDRVVSVAGPRVSFGTWALFDDEPRVLAATAVQDCRLLRIDRDEFNDLLADDVRIAQGIIRTVARKLRELAERAV